LEKKKKGKKPDTIPRISYKKKEEKGVEGVLRHTNRWKKGVWEKGSIPRRTDKCGFLAGAGENIKVASRGVEYNGRDRNGMEKGQVQRGVARDKVCKRVRTDKNTGGGVILL